MLKKYLLAALLLMIIVISYSQRVGIGTNTPNTNAALEIKDTVRGVLLPRMDSVHRKAIPNTKGLIVYDTTYSGFWYNTGAEWVNIPPKGNAPGDLLFWDGQKWRNLAAGTAGQSLIISASTGLPAWAGGASPAITTTSVSSITQTTATSGGNVITDGGAAITARGVVWSTATDPTVALSTKTVNGSGTGVFTSNLTGLAGGTQYYVRAYATNANGTTYGNQYNFVTSPASFTVGQNYGGGIIFYVDGSGQHGLIVSATDLSIGIAWDNNATSVTNASGLAIGTGAANTTTIINALGNGSYAASLCRLYYNGGGFTDWHLPSFYELNQLFLNKTAVGFPPSDPFASPWYYWSSSEIDQSNAWTINFMEAAPNQQNVFKGNQMRVRAVRAF